MPVFVCLLYFPHVCGKMFSESVKKMVNLMNRWICVVLTVLMSVSQLPAYAEENVIDAIYSNEYFQEEIKSEDLTYPTGEVYVIKDIDVKSEPDNSSDSVSSLRTGSVIFVDKIDSEWAHMTDDSGWVYAGYLVQDWDGIYSIYADGFASKYCGAVYTSLTVLPDNIRDFIRSCPFFLQSDEIKDESVASDDTDVILGLTSCFTDEVTNEITGYRINIIPVPDEYERILYHEVGHAWAFKNGYVGIDELNVLLDEQQDIIRLCGNLRSAHLVDNQDELFAEAFSLYFTDKATLKETASKSYDLIEWAVTR